MEQMRKNLAVLTILSVCSASLPTPVLAEETPEGEEAAEVTEAETAEEQTAEEEPVYEEENTEE